jgi:hypothetical protein
MLIKKRDKLRMTGTECSDKRESEWDEDKCRQTDEHFADCLSVGSPQTVWDVERRYGRNGPRV